MRHLIALISVFTIAAGIPAAQAPPTTNPAQRHFLWTIRAPAAPTSYLLGSLHVLSADYYPLSPTIENAFKQSTVLIEEINLDDAANPLATLPLLAKAMLTDGRTLDQLIAADLFKKVAARAEAAGIPVAAIQRMKPWMAAATLTMPSLQAAGFKANLGIDQYFFTKAKEKGMERRALETMAYQFDRLDQMPPAIQEAMLRSVIADLDTQLSSVKTIAAAWARGDTATLEKLLLGAMRESPELYDRLLVERNKNWVAPVETCLKEKTACFIVVGAAHLVGSHSLIALLRQKGYEVEQL